MTLFSLAAGALAGVLLRDRRIFGAILLAAAVLAFVGVRDQLFADMLSGLIWFCGHLALFEVALVVAGFAAAALRTHLRRTSLPRPVWRPPH